MNEDYQVESMEAAESTEGTPEVDLSIFDEGWDDDGQTGSVEEAGTDVEETGGESPDADQQEDEAAVEDNSGADETAQTGDDGNDTGEAAEGKADQLFTLKHLGQTREVSRDEVISLAQKGLDYDRKTTKLNDTIAEYEEFFKELSPGKSPVEFMDSIRARMLVQAEKAAGRELGETNALLRVQKTRTDKAKASEIKAEQEAQQKKEDAERKNNEAVALFAEAYPEVKANDIPKSVWDEFHKTGNLLAAYSRYENAQLKKRIAALETNAKNAGRSTGSRKTAGSGKAKDDFDLGWDSI